MKMLLWMVSALQMLVLSGRDYSYDNLFFKGTHERFAKLQIPTKVHLPFSKRKKGISRLAGNMLRLVAIVACCSSISSLPFICFSQINNLVANPSFEEYTGCPTNTSQIDSCINWFQPLPLSSTDYFNVCCSIPDFSGIVGVPANGFGYQYPRTGNAYSGIWAYEIGFIKEYIEGRLIEPLEANKSYCVELYYSIADSISQYFIVSSIGLFFSKDSIIAQNNNALPYIPQISENAINDVSNWLKLSGSFIAVGGEIFITIGNFEPVIIEDGTVYIYIDDVSVYLCDDTLPKPQELKIPNVFSPNNDGVNDVFEIENLQEGAEVNIYNRWGALLFESNNPNNFWDGRTKGGTPVPGGIYYYVVKIPGSESKKGFVEVLR